MTDPAERIDKVVDAMLDDQRPEGFAATGEEVEALQAAAALSAARPGAAEPDAGFVEALAGRLRAAANAEGGGAEPAAADRHRVAPQVLPLRTGRRGFLRVAGLAAAAAAAGVIGDRVAQRVANSADTDGTPVSVLSPENAVWHDVAALADVRSAGPVRFRAGAVEGVVALAAGGGVIAVSAICTHLGCVLDVAAADRLRCPCHGAEFSTDGTPRTGGYAIAPLPRLESRIAGDRVQVLA